MAKQGNFGRTTHDDTKACPTCNNRIERVVLICGKTRMTWKCENCGHFNNQMEKIDINALLKKTYPGMES